jgi:hypothetical protein
VPQHPALSPLALAVYGTVLLPTVRSSRVPLPREDRTAAVPENVRSVHQRGILSTFKNSSILTSAGSKQIESATTLTVLQRWFDADTRRIGSIIRSAWNILPPCGLGPLTLLQIPFAHCHGLRGALLRDLPNEMTLRWKFDMDDMTYLCHYPPSTRA